MKMTFGKYVVRQYGNYPQDEGFFYVPISTVTFRL